MQGRVLIGVVAPALAFAILAFAIDDGAALDATQYPDWKGQWMRLGPHSYDSSGIPFHEDGRAIVRERIASDKTNPSVLRNEITSIDSALTRPWTVQRSYRRVPAKEPIWSEYVCSENNRHVQIGSENYVLGADGLLMPTRKNQSPPDLRHFQ
jgi:hypothetical protein